MPELVQVRLCGTPHVSTRSPPLRPMSARCTQLGVTDVQIGLASLEEVFLAIARRAEMEAAAAEGRTTLAWQLEDGSTLEVGRRGQDSGGGNGDGGWMACGRVEPGAMKEHACVHTVHAPAPTPCSCPQVGMGEEYAEKDGVQYRIR